MANQRGHYDSPVQQERRQRILRATLELLKLDHPEEISMGQIAEASDVSTKTLYNLFSNRTTLLLAAASQHLDNLDTSEAIVEVEPGVARIVEFTRSALQLFQRAPNFMESVISVVVGISADEEAEHHRIGKTQARYLAELQAASQAGELLPDTDCEQLAQVLTASQWGVALMWQKGLMTADEMRHLAIQKHCVDLIPFCTPTRRKWLETVQALAARGLDSAEVIALPTDARKAG